MSETKTYYRTLIQVEVLSEEPFEWDDLRDVEYAITNGGCSGSVEEVERTTHTRDEMRDLLLKQDTDPEFLLGEDDHE